MALAWHYKGKQWEAAENYRRGSPLKFVKGRDDADDKSVNREVIETRGFARNNGDAIRPVERERSSISPFVRLSSWNAVAGIPQPCMASAAEAASSNVHRDTQIAL